jgi:hypothetical protein
MIPEEYGDKAIYKVVVELDSGEIMEAQGSPEWEIVIVNGVVGVPMSHDKNGIPTSTVFIPLTRVKSITESYEKSEIPDDTQVKMFDESEEAE